MAFPGGQQDRRRRPPPSRCEEQECLDAREALRVERAALQETLRVERLQWAELFFHSVQSPYRHFLFFTRENAVATQFRYRARCRLCEENRLDEAAGAGRSRRPYQAGLQPHPGWNIDGGPNRQRRNIDAHFTSYHPQLFTPAPQQPPDDDDDAGDSKDDDEQGGGGDGGGGGGRQAGGQPEAAAGGIFAPPAQPFYPQPQAPHHHFAVHHHPHHHIQGGRALVDVHQLAPLSFPTADMLTEHLARSTAASAGQAQPLIGLHSMVSDASPFAFTSDYSDVLTVESLTVPVAEVTTLVSAPAEANNSSTTAADTRTTAASSQQSSSDSQAVAAAREASEQDVAEEAEVSQLPLDQLSLE